MARYLGGDQLGLTTAQTALVAAGANAVLPGSGPIIAVGSGVLTNLFGGAGRDAQRQARVDVFKQGAKQGSLTAARVLFGGINNTAGHESPMWEKAVNELSSDARYSAIMTAAANARPYWDIHDDNMSSAMRAIVENELAAQGTRLAAPGSPRPTPSRVGGSFPASLPPDNGALRLPGMTTTAAFNYTPYVIGGGLLLAAVLLRRPTSRGR